MAIYYNLTEIAQAAGIPELMGIISTQTGGLWGFLIVLAVFVISFVNLIGRGNQASKAFIASLFLTMVTSIFLYAVEWIPEQMTLGLIVLTAIAIVMHKRD